MAGQNEDSFASFFSNVLKPGSSLHPKFLLALDAVFAALLVVLLSLAFLTQGNVHTIALTGIELCLWASVKWFVTELKKSDPNIGATRETSSTEHPKQE